MIKKLDVDSIPMYDQKPKGLIDIDKLESICSERLNFIDQMDQKIQLLQAKTGGNLELKLDSILLNWENPDGNQNDTISFFIVACLFCKSESQRHWLSAIESKIFCERLKKYNIDKIQLLKRMNIPIKFETIRKDKELYSLINFKNLMSKDNNSNSTVEVIKIPFEFVLNLLHTLNYYIYQGYVYINEADTMSIIEIVFKDNCMKRYANLFKSIDSILSDGRIKSLVLKLERIREEKKSEQLKKSDNFNKDKNVSLTDIEDYAARFYPLCMTNLHQYLTKESHLKHNGRLQYSLFLKGIGLSLDESLMFWKKSRYLKKRIDHY